MLTTQRTIDKTAHIPREILTFKDLVLSWATDPSSINDTSLSLMKYTLERLGVRNPRDLISQFKTPGVDLFYRINSLSLRSLVNEVKPRNRYALCLNPGVSGNPQVFFGPVEGEIKNFPVIGGTLQLIRVKAYENHADLRGVTHKNFCLVDRGHFYRSAHDQWSKIRNNQYGNNPYLSALHQMLSISAVTSAEFAERIVYYGGGVLHEIQHGKDCVYTERLYSKNGIKHASESSEVVADAILESESRLKGTLKSMEGLPGIQSRVASEILELSAELGSLLELLNELNHQAQHKILLAAFLYFCGVHYQQVQSTAAGQGSLKIFDTSRKIVEFFNLDDGGCLDSIKRGGSAYVLKWVNAVVDEHFIHQAQKEKNLRA